MRARLNQLTASLGFFAMFASAALIASDPCAWSAMEKNKARAKHCVSFTGAMYPPEFLPESQKLRESTLNNFVHTLINTQEVMRLKQPALTKQIRKPVLLTLGILFL